MESVQTRIQEHLENVIIPFWKNLRDDEYGGYYGFMDMDLHVDKKSEKGCILNNRILWFFSNAYTVLKDESLLSEADHAYEFFEKYCLDRELGGVFWSTGYDGTVIDSTKHTYNQAFAIYALSSYYEASGKNKALDQAFLLFEVIENRCRDKDGFLEALDRDFNITSNEKLSENGIMADRTMNTLLHVLEAYTELYRVSKSSKVKMSIEGILDIYVSHIYNPEKHRQEVFFDKEYNSLIDLISYGHDIESAWLIDRTLEIINEDVYTSRIRPITKDLTENILKNAFDGDSTPNECENGIVSEIRIWWVQAESVIGFLNGYEKDRTRTDFLNASRKVLDFIFDHVVDKRPGSEWFSGIDKTGEPIGNLPIVEPWKCPYHNGRMCFEIIKRGIDF